MKLTTIAEINNAIVCVNFLDLRREDELGSFCSCRLGQSTLIMRSVDSPKTGQRCQVEDIKLGVTEKDSEIRLLLTAIRIYLHTSH